MDTVRIIIQQDVARHVLNVQRVFTARVCVHIYAVRVRLGIMRRRRGLILAEVVLVSVGLLGQLRQQVARPLRHAVCHRVWNARMKMVANGPGQVSAVSSDEVRIMRKKKLKKLVQIYMIVVTIIILKLEMQ